MNQEQAIKARGHIQDYLRHIRSEWKLAYASAYMDHVLYGKPIDHDTFHCPASAKQKARSCIDDIVAEMEFDAVVARMGSLFSNPTNKGAKAE